MARYEKRYVKTHSTMKITKRKYDRLMDEMANSFTLKCQVPFYVGNYSELGESDDYASKIDTTLDEKDFVKDISSIGFFREYISDYDVIDHVRAFYHEAEHQKQRKNPSDFALQKKEDILCARIAGLDMAYYLKHYYEIATEMDAECESLPQTYEWILDNKKRLGNLSDQDVEFLMVDYINAKCEFPRYCLRIYGQDWQSTSECRTPNTYRDYKNINSIWTDLHECYERSQTNTNRNRIIIYDEKIENALYATFIDILNVCPDLKQVIDNAKTIRQQTKIITAINCMAYPELQQRFPEIMTMNISMKNCCGRDFTRSELLEINSRKETFLNENIPMTQKISEDEFT